MLVLSNQNLAWFKKEEWLEAVEDLTAALSLLPIESLPTRRLLSILRLKAFIHAEENVFLLVTEAAKQGDLITMKMMAACLCWHEVRELRIHLLRMCVAVVLRPVHHEAKRDLEGIVDNN